MPDKNITQFTLKKVSFPQVPPIEPDKKKCDELIKKYEKELAHYVKATGIGMWCRGKTVYKIIKELNHFETAYVYQRTAEITGVTPATLKQYVHLYLSWPNLKDALGRLNAPIKVFEWLSKHGYNEKNWKEVADLFSKGERITWKKFVNVMKENNMWESGRKPPECYCDVCQEKLPYELINKEWFTVTVHKNCWNALNPLKDLVEKLGGYEEIVKLKDLERKLDIRKEVLRKQEWKVRQSIEFLKRIGFWDNEELNRAMMEGKKVRFNWEVTS